MARKNEADQCILFPVGIDGHLIQVEAFREYFGMPIVLMTFSKRMDGKLAASKLRDEKNYSFPNYFLANRTAVDALDNEEVRRRIGQHCTAWGIPSVATFFYMDRYTRTIADYDDAMRLMLLYMDFAKLILDSENIAWLKTNVTTFFGFVLQSACVQMGIPALRVQDARADGRIEFSDELKVGGYVRGMNETFDALGNDPGAVAEDVRKEALAWLENFRSRPKRPRYADQCSVSTFKPSRIVSSMLKAARQKYDDGLEGLRAKKIDRQLRYGNAFGVEFFQETVLREMRTLLYSRVGTFNRNPDLSEPFFYLPLQFTPEIATISYGLLHEDFDVLICQLSKYIPDGSRIYVKEHTSMMGRRSPGFYSRIKKQFNVELVDPNVSTFDLIQNSRGIITLTGTTGWEGFLLGKPVFVFGNVFYDRLPGVCKLEINEELTQNIRAFLDGFEADEEAIQRAIVAYFATTYKATVGDVGEDETLPEKAWDNAILLARLFETQVRARA